MSVQAAKKEQGYTATPVLPVCRNCTHLKVQGFTLGEQSFIRKRRCGWGGFAVKPMASCMSYVQREDA